jgi:hypothetical protein
MEIARSRSLAAASTASQPCCESQGHFPGYNFAFMTLTKRQILNRKRRAPPDYDASLLMRLPTEIHQMLFDYLDEIDSLCLLLTCKYFARVGHTANMESHSISVGTDLLHVSQGFSDRRNKRLRLCIKCGIMRPKDRTYWDPHRCGWQWRKLIPVDQHQEFAEEVNAWNAGQNMHCPRCFGTLVAQGNMDAAFTGPQRDS